MTKTTKKKNPSPLRSIPILSLPDELLLSCFARVSRSQYPTLSLVSKRFRSLLSSPELYKARSLSGHTESCLYICLWSSPGYRWFKKTTNGYVLAKVPVRFSPPHSARFWGLVAVGSNIYNIGSRSDYEAYSSTVSVLDCRTHTWREAPSLPVELTSISASVLDQKIYVAGLCEYGGSVLQVFDTKTQTWDLSPPPPPEEGEFCASRSACIDGKFHVVTSKKKVVAYNAKGGCRWEVNGKEMGRYMRSDCYCEIENVLYSVLNGYFRWFDTEEGLWRDLKGLVGLPEFPPGAPIRLADYGGKMAVLWEEKVVYEHSFKSRTIVWCAEISIERRPKSCEIWGIVDWFDRLLQVPLVNDLVKVLVVTL
ncbi:unnamed protein product [Microthlaspi erraticum]|uniref:F-box domain-containing protein n=1 Tax=Microthlaspi erraticum TaxID=1685480 RepID=A0A6D2KFR8_9BRAS|nr:unnamed protein product [Microthlaspi erraticum]